MKLEFFVKAKIKAGLAMLETEIQKLDAEDFEWVAEQVRNVDILIHAEQVRREESRAALERKE